MTTKDEVRTLWKLCFNDSEEFMDLYFNKRYRDEINMAIREDGKIISALQMIPYPMSFCGGVIPTAYISGACTHPRYREHGAMRRLLKETHRRMYRDGILLSTLIPAEEWLFGYYATSGYVPAFGYALKRVKADELRIVSSAGYRVELCASPGRDHYRYFDARMRGRNCCILHSEEDFQIIWQDMKLGGGNLLVAKEEEKIMGMAFAIRGEDRLYIKELLADNDAVRDRLLQEASYIYKVGMVEYLAPASAANPSFLGMARVIRAEEMLKLFAAKHPELQLNICLEGDDVIPENNGYYTVKDGLCLYRQLPEEKSEEYTTYTVASFTRLLMEAEHPYMSLMLN